MRVRAYYHPAWILLWSFILAIVVASIVHSTPAIGHYNWPKIIAGAITIGLFSGGVMGALFNILCAIRLWRVRPRNNTALLLQVGSVEFALVHKWLHDENTSVVDMKNMAKIAGGKT